MLDMHQRPWLWNPSASNVNQFVVHDKTKVRFVPSDPDDDSSNEHANRNMTGENERREGM